TFEFQIRAAFQQSGNQLEAVANGLDGQLTHQAAPGLLDILNAEQVERDAVSFSQSQQAAQNLVMLGILFEPGSQAVDVMQFVLMQIIDKIAQVEYAQCNPGTVENALVAAGLADRVDSRLCSCRRGGSVLSQRPDEPSQGRAEQAGRSEEHTSELQSRENVVCRLLLEKKKD